MSDDKAIPREELPPNFNFWYACTVERVIDADTIQATVDLGFHISMAQRFRLYGINAYETNDTNPEKRELARRGRDYVQEALISSAAGAEVVLQTHMDRQEKFGRFLAVVFYRPRGESGWRNLNKELVDLGLAVPYML
jgi:endonuclease YncB( thermonuclease family)